MRASRSGLLALLLVALSSAPLPHSTDVATSSATAATPRALQASPTEAKPQFVLTDLDGSQQELKRHAGRVVLVHFFATWCEPCREELSSLSLLVDVHKHEPLSVVAINVAEVAPRVRRFLDGAPVRFPILLDADRAVTRAWGVSTLPTTFVLDRNLVPRLFVEGDLDWMRTDVLAALAEVGAIEAK